MDKHTPQTKITMVGNQKSIGVPVQVHDLLRVLSARTGKKLWVVVAEALEIYDRLHPPRKGE